MGQQLNLFASEPPPSPKPPAWLVTKGVVLRNIHTHQQGVCVGSNAHGLLVHFEDAGYGRPGVHLLTPVAMGVWRPIGYDRSVGA
jgi:hypothetical protein